jgi:hypothetical protein
MLLFRAKYSVPLSFFVLFVQIPYIYIGGVSLLRVGIAFNLYFTAVWNARAGVNATVLGVNVLALGILLILLWCRNTVNDHVHETSLSANAVEPYTTDPDSSPL